MTYFGRLVLALARLLDTLVEELAKLTSSSERAVGELPEGKVIMSFPRAGQICAAPKQAKDQACRVNFRARWSNL